MTEKISEFGNNKWMLFGCFNRIIPLTVRWFLYALIRNSVEDSFPLVLRSSSSVSNFRGKRKKD